MDAADALHGIIQNTLGAYGLTDLAVGTVVAVDPVQVKLREEMPPVPEEVLWFTAAVIEKKIPVLAHQHITKGFRHDHTVAGLGHGHSLTGLEHSHSGEEGSTGPALGGSFPASEALSGIWPTSEALLPDAFNSDEQLKEIVCYEDGTPLPVENGYIILNRGLAVGDRVLLLKVLRSQQFIVLSRIYERGARHAARVRR